MQPLSARPNPLSRYYETISLPKPNHAKTKQHEPIVGVTRKSNDRVSLISHAFEDNQAALYVATANSPRLTARNKHWNIKHHWFRSHLGEGKDCIKILPIPTQDQRVDIFTKALTKALFESLRKLLMGW
jgi:hypothetical protein